jgi:hypothetical protein
VLGGGGAVHSRCSRWSALISNRARDNEASYGSADVKNVSNGVGKGKNVDPVASFDFYEQFLTIYI